jgi:hypothetical protein
MLIIDKKKESLELHIVGDGATVRLKFMSDDKFSR